MKYFYKRMINSWFFNGMVFGLAVITLQPMKEISSEILAQLNSCRQERAYAANELQNEVNQLLASVLLWIRFAEMENKLPEDQSVRNAENNLKEAIDRVRALHYSLIKEM